jgi:hypothetical protein
LYLGISFYRMYSRYSDVGLKNDMWHKSGYVTLKES